MSKIEHAKQKIKALENGDENPRIKDPVPKGSNAIKFLRRFRPDGPWLIVSIVPDGVVSARTFTDLEKARTFIVDQNKTGANIYYGINSSLAMHKKARKNDITRVTHLHADLDPNDDETSEAFKQRIWPKIERYKAQPSFVIDSGNGFQLLWRLERPVKIDSPEMVMDIEARNYALAEAFGASASTRNIDRIFRIPGTTNYPNARKRKLGRVECKAKLIQFNDVAYPLSSFPQRVAPTNTDSKRHERDESGSGYGYRFMQERRARGGFYVSVRKAILADQSPAGEWSRRVDERQLRRAWDAADKQIEPVQTVKQYEMVKASDVLIRPPQWLWRGHLLRGAQELLTGVPGLGKSQVQCSYAACVTTGKEWPDGCPGIEPANVIMVTGEDALDQAVVPRLMAAGADLSRVFFLKAIKQDNKRRMFLLGEDLEQLEQMIKDIGDVALVSIDPITAFMGKLNSSSATDVRSQLGPLRDLAERTDVAVSTVTHPPKAGGHAAIDHFIGSQAFIAHGRVGHLCVEEMGMDANSKMVPTGRKLFTTPKHNVSAAMPTLAYEIEETVVGTNRATRTEAVYIAWQEQVELSADQAIAASKGPGRTTPVDDFLRQLLGKGEMWKSEIDKAAFAKGFSLDQLRGAGKRLGVKSRKLGVSGWKWSLPKDETRP